MKRKRIPGTNFDLIIANYYSDENGKNDRSFIRQHCDIFFGMLEDSYREIGGCMIYDDPLDMVSKAKRYSVIVEREDDTVVAVCTFRRFADEGSFKGILIGGNYSLADEIRIEGVKLLVQHMVVNWNHFYWIECSDAIEHCFDKYGGILIPVSIVPEILEHAGIPTDGIVADERKGNEWYTRPLKGGLNISKRMYGFASRDIMDRILDSNAGPEIEERIRGLIGADRQSGLKESLNFLGRRDVLYRVLNYIDDVYYERGGLKIISKSLYELLWSIYDDGNIAVSRLDLDEDHSFEYNMLLRSLRSVLKNTTVVTFNRFY